MKKNMAILFLWFFLLYFTSNALERLAYPHVTKWMNFYQAKEWMLVESTCWINKASWIECPSSINKYFLFVCICVCAKQKHRYEEHGEGGIITTLKQIRLKLKSIIVKCYWTWHKCQYFTINVCSYTNTFDAHAWRSIFVPPRDKFDRPCRPHDSKSDIPSVALSAKIITFWWKHWNK